jgi:hypothetical protein
LRTLVALVALAAALAAAPAGLAKSFTLPQADVTVQLERDGSVAVDERITFDFAGAFSGAFREIPLREGESIDRVVVGEGEQAYRPGASAEIGSFGLPGSFGVEQLDGRLRIVWHYSASFEQRSTGCAGSPSRTTTSWTSTSRSGATSGRPASAG